MPTFDSQQRRVQYESTALIPHRVDPRPGYLPIWTRELDLLFHSQAATKLHILDFIHRRAGLLHLLDGRE